MAVKTTNIKILDDYIKCYQKEKEVKAKLENAKLKVIEHLKSNDLENTKYKGKLISLCEKKTYTYTQVAIEMAEAASKQKKIEELSGDAKLKNTTEYIRLSDVKVESANENK